MLPTKDRKQIILDVASRFFLRFGYTKTSLDEIATEANIAKGTIYYYFPSKEELFIQVAEDQARLYMTSLRETINSIDGFENKLKTFIQAPVKLAYEKLQGLLEGLKSIPFNFQKHFETFREEKRTLMIEILRDILAVGQREGKLSQSIPLEKLSEAMNDWLLLGNKSIMVIDFEALLSALDEDLDILTDLILYGIVKRG